MKTRHWKLGMGSILLALAACATPGPGVDHGGPGPGAGSTMGRSIPPTSAAALPTATNTDPPVLEEAGATRQPLANLTSSPAGGPAVTPRPTATHAPVTSIEAVQRISAEEAWALLVSDRATLYDTRVEASYGSHHATGAVSFPESEAAERIGELPSNHVLVFY